MIVASEMVLPLSITAIFTTSGSHDSRHAQQVDTLYNISIYRALYIYFFSLSVGGRWLCVAADSFSFSQSPWSGVGGAAEEALS